jgi:hypothetical protein
MNVERVFVWIYGPDAKLILWIITLACFYGSLIHMLIIMCNKWTYESWSKLLYYKPYLLYFGFLNFGIYESKMQNIFRCNLITFCQTKATGIVDNYTRNVGDTRLHFSNFCMLPKGEGFSTRTHHIMINIKSIT